MVCAAELRGDVVGGRRLGGDCLLHLDQPCLAISRALSGAGKRTAASGVAWSGCASLRGPLSEPWCRGVEARCRGCRAAVELLSRDRGVEACRGLSRPVEACRGLLRPVEAETMLDRVEGCRGVSRVSRVSRVSSRCRVLSRGFASKVSRCPRWQDAVAAHQQNLGSSCKAVSSLSCSLSVAPC